MCPRSIVRTANVKNQCLVGFSSLQNVDVVTYYAIFRLVDDRCVLKPDAGDLSNPPKKFRGKYIVTEESK